MRINSSLKRLLISQTRTKLIKILFANPQQLYYVRQLVRLAKEEINSVRRELKNLSEGRLIQSEWRGNRLYYWADQQSPFFYDLLVLANKSTSLGLGLSAKKKLKMLFYSYRFATHQPDSPDQVDLIMIGSLPSKSVEALINKEQEARGREINYMIINRHELELRKKRRDPFIIDFFLNCPVLIIGNPQRIVNI